MIDQQRFIDGARAAFLRAGERVQPDAHAVRVVDGRPIVVLLNRDRLLAVYALKNGRLARLPDDEWPAVVVAEWALENVRSRTRPSAGPPGRRCC